MNPNTNDHGQIVVAADRLAERGAAELQRELRDLLCLAVVGDHVRWVVVDDDGELGDWLAEAVREWRALADQVASRLVTLGIAPDGRVRSLAADISLNWVPDGWLRREEAERLLAGRLRIVASWARLRHSEAADADTARLLDVVADRLEQRSKLSGRSRGAAAMLAAR